MEKKYKIIKKNYKIKFNRNVLVKIVQKIVNLLIIMNVIV